MLALQAPSRNLFSRRIPQTTAPRNIVDYLDARRGVKPTWGEPGDRSPQWRASRELAKSGFFERIKAELLSLTRTRRLRPTDTDPISWIVGRYVADVTALDDQVDAVNRLLGTITLSETRMPIDTDQDFRFAPAGDDWASRRAFSEAWNMRRAREAQEERARARFARELFIPKDAGEVLGPSIIDAELLVGDRGSVLAACQHDIARRCEAAAEYLWESLMRGLGSGLLGMVAWHAADVCWYVRGEHRLRTRGHWTQNGYEHWEVCKEVHLMDAMHLAGIPGWLDLPRTVQGVVDAIPPILHPEIGTVVGTMVKEREISWLAGEVSYPAERVLPQRRLVFDPAIVIGPIVLTGWELPEHTRPGWWMRLDCALAR
jgi:hypothetical protein